MFLICYFGGRRSCGVEEEDLTIYFDGLALVIIVFGVLSKTTNQESFPPPFLSEGPVLPLYAPLQQKEPPQLLNPFLPCSLAIGSLISDKQDTRYDPSIYMI